MSILSRVARFDARSVVVATTVALLLGAAIPALTAANSTSNARVAPGFLVPVYAGSSSDNYAPIPAPTRALAAGQINGSLKTSSTFVVTYHNFTTKAKAAFQAAVNVWQSIVVSDQVIRIDAFWKPLGSNVLGSAGPVNIYLEQDQGHDFWYPTALHNARCHCDEDADPDIQANFNSNFASWYLGTDGNTPNNKWDFESVVLHELGHGLGFLSSFQQSSISGRVSWGFGSKFPMRYDANEWDSKTGGHTLITHYTNGSAALKTQVTDGSVYLGGAHLEAALGGRAKLFAPNPWQQGSSNSHFDEAQFAPGGINSLMTPVLNNGESIHNPGPATVAVMQDIGWSVAGSSDDTTPPVVGDPVVSFVSPQTMGTAVTIRVSWPAATDDSGISSYELQRQAGAGAWTPVTLVSQTSTFADVSVTRGSNYSFRVRATDGASNTGDWTTTSSGHVTTTQETASANLQYVGAWSSSSVSGAAGGKVAQSSTGGDTADFTFTGTTVAFVSTLAPARGIAEIWLDSGTHTLIDLHGSSKQAKRVVWASDPGLTPGSHTLHIVVTGTTSGSSSRIDVDAFLTWP